MRHFSYVSSPASLPARRGAPGRRPGAVVGLVWTACTCMVLFSYCSRLSSVRIPSVFPTYLATVTEHWDYAGGRHQRGFGMPIRGCWENPGGRPRCGLALRPAGDALPATHPDSRPAGQPSGRLPGLGSQPAFRSTADQSPRSLARSPSRLSDPPRWLPGSPSGLVAGHLVCSRPATQPAAWPARRRSGHPTPLAGRPADCLAVQGLRVGCAQPPSVRPRGDRRSTA